MPGYKFMIVENNPDELALWEYIQHTNDALFLCDGGLEALRRLNKIEYNVDAVISDLALGDMDGVTLAENIRRNESIRGLPGCKIFWLTGYPMNNTLMKAKVEHKVTEVFTKPQSPVEMVERVKEYLTIGATN